MSDDLLRTSLLDLYNTLGSAARGILLGGGYGLYLKQVHLAHAGQRTLVQTQFWPSPRATQDLDLILSAELVADPESMGTIRAALDKLGYQVVAGAQYMQFTRTIATGQKVKIDLLTAQLDVLQEVAAIHADDRRARPIASNRPSLHAHPTDGALLLMESPLFIRIAGALSDGSSYAAQVAVPHPFPYLLMKLTAYRDRHNDVDKDLGRHHSLDVFRIVAMLTESERDQIRERLRRLAGNAQVQSCRQLVCTDFASSTASGVLAMRQHPLWQNNEQLPVFIEVLKELFP